MAPDDAGLLEAWRQRRARRQARAEARHVVAEARRILRKKAYRIPEAARVEIEEGARAVDEALAAADVERVREALAALDESVDRHLAFARKSTLREYAESIGVAVGIALLLRAFVVEAFQIPSGSMIPTLEVGDHIFVSKFAYGVDVLWRKKKILELAEPRRGDVIVFRYPLGPDVDYIKRVMGVPGDTLEIRDNQVFINGLPVARDHAGTPCRYRDGPPRADGSFYERECELWIETVDGHPHRTITDRHQAPRDYPPVVIPPRSVFVMGDNRDNSNDSRVWGLVSYDLIKGRALIVWWSRGPTRGEWSAGGLLDWFRAIRWRRFFQVVA